MDELSLLNKIIIINYLKEIAVQNANAYRSYHDSI